MATKITADQIEKAVTYQVGSSATFGKYSVSYVGAGIFRVNGQGYAQDSQGVADWLNSHLS